MASDTGRPGFLPVLVGGLALVVFVVGAGVLLASTSAGLGLHLRLPQLPFAPARGTTAVVPKPEPSVPLMLALQRFKEVEPAKFKAATNLESPQLAIEPPYVTYAWTFEVPTPTGSTIKTIHLRFDKDGGVVGRWVE